MVQLNNFHALDQHPDSSKTRIIKVEVVSNICPYVPVEYVLLDASCSWLVHFPWLLPAVMLSQKAAITVS